jgi:LmbE family N-acetylglucosaminyl deacetylase
MSFSRSLVRALARRAVYPLIEALTLLLLRVRMKRSKHRPQARPLSAPGGRRVLVIAAHPDDETIGCAGAIMHHVEAGDSVKVLIVTDGSGSRAGGLSPQEMARVRRREVDQLAQFWSAVAFERLDYAESRWSEPDLVSELRRVLASYHPDLVYAPSCVDFHPEHIIVAKALARALVLIQHPSSIVHRPSSIQSIRVYEMQVPLGIELTNLYCFLGTRRAEKEHAIAIYRSQKGALDLWKRQAGYLGALYGAKGGAEAFWEVSPEGYCRIMARADWDWRTTPFKSLSGRPFDDLAAHTRGRAMRLDLRRLAEGE